MEKSKNKGLIVLIVVLCIIVLGLVGFIVYDKVLNKPEEVKNKKELKEVNKSIKIDSTKKIVYDLVNKEIDGPSMGEKVELKLPYININSDYANEVNDEIAELQKDMEKNPKGGNVTYNFFENKNILSVLIVEETPSDYVYYYAYNFNKTNGKYISNKELIDQKNFNKKDIQNKLDRYVTTRSEEYVNGTKKIVDEGDLSLSKAFNEGLLGYPMYLNENNELCIISYFSSASFAGGGHPYSYIYNIDKKEAYLKLNR